MANVTPIRTAADYQAALVRVNALMDAAADSPEGDELDVLVDLVALYESRRNEIGHPTPVEAIEFRMDQQELSARDLVPLIGSRAKVSEVLSGKRGITMSMARALHRHLGIPAEVLLQDPDVDLDDSLSDVEWTRFPLTAMARRGWIPDIPDLRDRAEELVRGLIQRAGGPQAAAAVQFRRNDHRRLNAKTDPYALQAWCWQVLAAANARPPDAPYQPGAVTPEFLRETARLSASAQGPLQAQQFLAAHGIALAIVPHLPRTHLDGAALRLADGRPVVGLTLRYDRLDNFWFCLLHELAHVGRHQDGGNRTVFVDDHSLRPRTPGPADAQEAEADAWTEEALIPAAAWHTSVVRRFPTMMNAIDLAQSLSIHPAIVAGRVRHECGNYRLLSHLVGSGHVRRQFDTNA